MKRVIVIGAGASGLVAAYFAAKRGNEVIVIEKNEKCGKKIYITGRALQYHERYSLRRFPLERRYKSKIFNGRSVFFSSAKVDAVFRRRGTATENGTGRPRVSVVR